VYIRLQLRTLISVCVLSIVLDILTTHGADCHIDGLSKYGGKMSLPHRRFHQRAVDYLAFCTHYLHSRVSDCVNRRRSLHCIGAHEIVPKRQNKHRDCPAQPVGNIQCLTNLLHRNRNIVIVRAAYELVIHRLGHDSRRKERSGYKLRMNLSTKSLVETRRYHYRGENQCQATYFVVCKRRNACDTC
jgi:hypothetical protein